MKFTYKSGALSQVRGITRLCCTVKDVGNLSVFYGLYEIELDSRKIFAVSVSDSSEFRLCTLEDKGTISELYKLISENGVDTASFDGVLDDFIYSLNNIL